MCPARSNVEYYYVRLLDAVAGMVAHVSDGERCQFVNQAFASWLNVPRDDLVNQRIRDVLGEPTYRSHRPIIEAAQSGGPVTFQETCTRPGHPEAGTTLYGRVVPLPGDGFLAHLIDIDEIRDRLCEEDEKKRQEYVHDIKNLMTPVLGYLDLLALKYPDDPALDGACTIFKDVAATLLAEEEQHAARQTPIAVANSHIRGVVATLLAGRPDVALEVSLDDDAGVVPYNGLVCLRVLGNLIRNALRHAWPPGGGTSEDTDKHIMVRGRIEAGAYALSVADNGVGFETVPPQGGPLLRHGLASVGRLCRSVGWDLRAGNGPEGGALVRIRIPVSDTPTAGPR